jgi:hypothetical protein
VEQLVHKEVRGHRAFKACKAFKVKLAQQAHKEFKDQPAQLVQQEQRAHKVMRVRLVQLGRKDQQVHQVVVAVEQLVPQVRKVQLVHQA